MLSNIKSKNTSNWPKINKLIDHFITEPILFHYFLHHEEHIVTFAYIRVLSQAHFVSSCDPAPRNASPEFSDFDVIKLDASQFWNTWYTLSYVEVSWQHEPLKKECSVPAQHHNTVMVCCSWVLLDSGPFCLAILVIYTGKGMYPLIPQVFRHSPLAELVVMAYSFISNLHKCYFTTFLLYFEHTDAHSCQLRARPGLIVSHYLVTHQNYMSNIFYHGIFCNRWCERKRTQWNSSLSNMMWKKENPLELFIF
jgi:hypothetical protein